MSNQLKGKLRPMLFSTPMVKAILAGKKTSNQLKGKLRPMLFSTPMVKAILAGRKTQTRRVIKPQPELLPEKDEFAFMRLDDFDARLKELQSKGYYMLQNVHGKLHALPKQPAMPGDVIWVREKWAPIINDEGENIGYFHSTDIVSWRVAKWKPSIHMPFEAARLFLYVEDVRVERLQEITAEDAIAEGITPLNPEADEEEFILYQNFQNPSKYFFAPVWSFQSLWKSINSDESWDANPFVWVYKFTEITKQRALEVASR